MSRHVLAVVVVLGASAGAGCVGPDIVATGAVSAAQAGVSEFTKRRLRTAWELPMETMFQAARAALTELGYDIEGQRTEGKEWFVGARQQDGSAIEIYLTRSSPKVTLLGIRVGMFGNQPLSRLIADAIDRQVKARGYADSVSARQIPTSGP